MQRFPDFVLQLADILSASETLRDLLPPLADCLHQVADFEYLNLALHDARHQVMRLHHVPELPGSSLSTLPVDDSVSGLIWKTGETFLSSDLSADLRFPDLLDRLRGLCLKSYCAVPLNTSHNRLGAIGVGSPVRNAYSPFQVRMLRRIGGLVALVLDNMLIRDNLGEERARLQQLLDVGNAIFTNLQWDELFPALSRSLFAIFGYDYASVALHDPATDSLHSYPLDPAARRISSPRMLSAGDPAESVFREPRTIVFLREAIMSVPGSFVESALQQGMQSLLCIPLRTAQGVIGTLSIGSRRVAAFDTADLQVLEPIAVQVAMSLDNARAYKRMRQLHAEISGEPTHLADEVAPGPFGEILGNTRALKQALDQTETVASSDATVLVLGETGTGKDLIARAVHRLSRRSAAPFIKMNCAAIPTGLLESELFGHEKGAFTGAVTHKIGRLEMADKGTLFLDEVGEIPLELQPKLLRILQDQEFERLGGTRTIRVDIRLVAATNRDLATLVREKQFRNDLYYRLHVFPIRMPSLRERAEDIPLLVHYFTRKISRRMRKRIQIIPAEVMQAMLGWHWPGNVRELQNFIERSVILSDSEVLCAPLSELTNLPDQRRSDPATLENIEREHILRVLRETGGIISGPTGAARKLGLKRTTLQSRMLKLNITRPDYRD